MIYLQSVHDIIIELLTNSNMENILLISLGMLIVFSFITFSLKFINKVRW
jgi:hypothetical protein